MSAQSRLDELRTIAGERLWTQGEFDEAMLCVTHGAARWFHNYPASAPDATGQHEACATEILRLILTPLADIFLEEKYAPKPDQIKAVAEILARHQQGA